MSSDTKNKIVIFYKYLVREIHRGNFLPLIVTGVVSWFIIVPTYNYIDARIEALFAVDNYVLQDNEALHNELEELKKQLKNQMTNRRAGHVGITYH